jgi:hypothetical protein
VGRIITLDTEVLVIAAGGATSIDRGKDRAHQMIFHHMGQGDDIYLPAPAFAECCHSIEPELLAQLRIATFGSAAAMLANRITKAMREAAKSFQLGDEAPAREELKVDAMILATAESLPAHILYVGKDPWFAKACERAKLRVQVKELPPFEPQEQELPLED